MSILNLKGYLPIVIITVLNIVILFVRNSIVGNTTYNFLLFNLFLGFVPLLVALILSGVKNKINNFLLFLGCGLWLLFYPNSTYMITDLIHIEPNEQAVVYDTLIIFSISILSLFFGFFSLRIIHDLLIPHIGHKWVNVLIIGAIVLSSFGIYLGRVLRLNSWDLFTNPGKVVSDILGHLWPINENPATYYMIILFSFIQFVILSLTKELDIERN
ncbi:MAG: DUF1361 domain-containing protein [Saprospiraceae bacterium]|nr:DUF1361 domain-containing protein [Saprospiraceae bacterium]